MLSEEKQAALDKVMRLVRENQEFEMMASHAAVYPSITENDLRGLIDNTIEYCFRFNWQLLKTFLDTAHEWAEKQIKENNSKIEKLLK